MSTAKEQIKEIAERAYKAHCDSSIDDHSELYTISNRANRALAQLAVEEKEKEKITQQAVKAAVSIIMDRVVETIGVDGHSWSDRPCQTCKAISGMIGRPYGCYWYQALAPSKGGE